MLSKELSRYIEKHYARRKLKNRLISILLFLAAAIALIPLFSVFSYVLIKGLPALTPSFFSELPRPVGEPGGGMAHAIAGTATLVGIASLIGIPWGLAIGLFLSEYDYSKRDSKIKIFPSLPALIRFSADLLGSIPSIIIGLFVYALVVLPMKHFSAWAGGLALGILMIPTVARSVEELLKLVPIHIREAGLALGLPRWKVILRIVLSGSAKAIITGIMLAVARVAGETAPLLFTAFSNRFWQSGLDQPIASIPVQIYSYAISPYEEWHQQAWGGSLVLVTFVFCFNVITRFFLRSPKGSST